MKRIVSLLLIVALSLGFMAKLDVGSVCAEETSSETLVLTVGVETEVIIREGNARQYYEFIPEESGWYMYYSSGNHSLQGVIYGTVNSNSMISDNLREYFGRYEIYGDFKMVYYFEAGQKYDLSSMPSRSSEGTYKVCIVKLSKATDMSFGTQEEINKYIGEESNLKLYYTPEDCEPEKITWVSDDTDVVEIDENGKCYYKALGSTTVTATNESGLTASVKVNVINYPEIKHNEEIKSWAGHSNEETYTFIPEVSGTYEYSVKTDSGMVQEALVTLTIYDKNHVEIARSSGWSAYETVLCNMVVGECYYLHFDSYAYDVLGDAISKVIRIGPPIYDDVAIDTTDELKQVGEEMTLEGIKEIQLNEEKEVDIVFFGARSIYKFTPAEDGEYKFSATGNDHILFSILKEDFNYISSGKSPYTIKLEAGKTYVITSYISGASPTGFGEYIIEINKLPKVEKIELNREEAIVGNIGDRIQLSVTYAPEGCESVDLDWVSSDRSVASVFEGNVYLKKLGKATITAYCENGLSDSIEVEVIHPLYKIGDVTMDGNINAEDALMVLGAAAKIAELTEEEAMLGNVNSDSIINAQDALEILKTVAKITE